jgi:hypothetical protein
MGLGSKFEQILFDIRFQLLLFCLTCAFGVSVFNIAITLLIVFVSIRQHYAICLLFFSGVMKNASLFSFIPIDLTVYSIVIFIIFLLRKADFRNLFRISEPIALLALMFCVGIISISYSPAPMIYHLRAGFPLLFFYLPLCYLIINAYPTDEVDKSIHALMHTGLFLALLWSGLSMYNYLFDIELYSKINMSTKVFHLSAFGESYMTIGGLLVFAVLVFFNLIIWKQAKSTFLLVAFFICLAILFNIPARGLIYSLIITCGVVAFTLVVTSTTRLSYILKVLFSVVVVLALVGLANWALDLQITKTAMNRLTDLSFSTESVVSRIGVIKVAFKNWTHQPLMGLGIDAVPFLNSSSGLHAHNILLESIFEFGLLGSIPFLIFFINSMITAFYQLIKSAIDHYSPGTFATSLFLLLFFFAQSSGNLGGIRQFWILCAFLYIMPADIKRNFYK